jgi:hypothetical protein
MVLITPFSPTVVADCCYLIEAVVKGISPVNNNPGITSSCFKPFIYIPFSISRNPAGNKACPLYLRKRFFFVYINLYFFISSVRQKKIKIYICSVTYSRNATEIGSVAINEKPTSQLAYTQKYLVPKKTLLDASRRMNPYILGAGVLFHNTYNLHATIFRTSNELFNFCKSFDQNIDNLLGS